MSVELPEDLADEFWLHSLAGEDITKIEKVRSMSVRDALLWKHLSGYSAYLNEEHLKSIRENAS